MLGGPVIRIVKSEEGLVFRVDIDLLSRYLLDLIDPIKVASEIEEMDITLRAIVKRSYYRGVRGCFRKLLGRKLPAFPKEPYDQLVERVREANGGVLCVFLQELLESLRSVRLPEHSDVVLVSSLEEVEDE